MIEDQKRKGWTFTYIGANHDVENFALSISITNTMKFSTDEKDMKRMFDKEKNSRISYSKKIRDKEDTSNDYYTDIPNDKA